MNKKEYECKISDMRDDCGISQQKLADAIGVSRQTISAIEQHICEPSISIALKLAKYFHIPVETLFILHKQETNVTKEEKNLIAQYEKETAR